MTETRNQHLTALDVVARGDADIAEAVRILKSAFSSDYRLGDRIYCALRDLTWRALRARTSPVDYAPWFNVVKHAASLAAKHDLPEVNLRLRTLMDLWAQSARFETLQPIEEVLSRKHVVDLLKAIAIAPNPLPRSALIEQVKLESANLSRLIGLLCSRALVERSRLGKEAYFSLSSAGRALLVEKNIIPAPRPGDDEDEEAFSVSIDFDELPVMTMVWDRQGRCLHAHARLMKALGLNTDAPNWKDWVRAVSPYVANRIPQSGGETCELRVSEQNVLHYELRELEQGGHIVAAFDVSTFASRALMAERHEAKARDALADVEGRLATQRAFIAKFRQNLAKTSSDGLIRLRAALDGLDSVSSELRDELKLIEKSLWAINYGVSHFAELTDPQLPGIAFSMADPRRLIEETIEAIDCLTHQKTEIIYHDSVGSALNLNVRPVLGQVMTLGPKPMQLGIRVSDHHMVVTFSPPMAGGNVLLGAASPAEDVFAVWNNCASIVRNIGYMAQVHNTPQSSNLEVWLPMETDEASSEVILAFDHGEIELTTRRDNPGRRAL